MEAATRADPWTLPAFLVLGVLWALWAFLRGFDIVGIPRWLTFLTGLAVITFLSVTDTPSSMAGSWHRNMWFDWHLHSSSGNGAFTLTAQDGLNALIGVPIGLAGALLAAHTRHVRWVVVVVALPVLAELTQMLLPVLGRIGFSLTDVALNELGCVIGLVLGALIFLVVFRAGAASPAAANKGRNESSVERTIS